MKFLVTFRPNWWIIGAIFEEICIYVEENEGFGQPLIPFILLIGELQMGPYMVTYWCVSECCSLIGSHRLYVYRNAWGMVSQHALQVSRPTSMGEVEGSGLGGVIQTHTGGESPGPHLGGLQAHTQGVSQHALRQTHSCYSNNFTWVCLFTGG